MERINAVLEAVQAANDGLLAAILAAKGPGLDWIKQRWQAIGVVVTVVGGSFAAGSGTVLWRQEWKVVPGRLTTVEVRLDTLTLAQKRHEREWEQALAIQAAQYEELRCEIVEALRGTAPPGCRVLDR